MLFRSGVEMEALTGVSVALLTIYDMCKALDKAMEIGEIYLCRKTGGKSGEVHNERPGRTCCKNGGCTAGGYARETFRRTGETGEARELDYQLGNQVRQKPSSGRESRKGTLDDLDIL